MKERRSINATCPECRGPLVEVKDGDLAEHECLVGHAIHPRLCSTHTSKQRNGRCGQLW
jgi:hypothetical protein